VIRTNLSTKPFYNDRAVNVWLGLLAALVVGATLFNVVSMIRYSESDSVLARQAADDTDRAAALRAEAAKLRASVDLKQVDLISTEARLANVLIDRRVFSWTELFNQFEKTLPPEVRITAVRPTVDRDGRILLIVNLVARGVDDVNQFMESLEQTQAFASLLTREERVNETGQLEATLESFYTPARAAAAAAPATTPEAPAAPPAEVAR
jgi:Tfp pilus assembly protein PilN